MEHKASIDRPGHSGESRNEDRFPINDEGDLPAIVSVTFKPEALTTLEEWRMVLGRLLPASRLPILRVVLSSLWIVGGMTWLGYWIGRAGWPGLQPEPMAFAFFLASLLYPYRLLKIKAQLTRVLRSLGPLTIELSGESVTIRSKHRMTRIDWEGVVEVRADSKQVVIRYQAGDASWIATRHFADHEHEARFLELARRCLAQARHDPASQAVQAPR